jgi:SAM-dependent methyltransferase
MEAGYDSFHHYPHPEEVLKEMKRVLKIGGRLLIGEGYVVQPFRAILNLSFRFSNSSDFKSYGKHEFIRMLEDNGFRIAEVKKRVIEQYCILLEYKKG